MNPVRPPDLSPFLQRADGMTQSASASGLNLSVHRGPVSVWDRPGWNGAVERIAATRWLLGAGGGALAFEGIRRRSFGGALLASAGASLAWWAFARPGDFDGARQRLLNFFERAGWRRTDRVHDESEQSFPASDAPSWTPTVGTGIRHHTRRK